MNPEVVSMKRLPFDRTMADRVEDFDCVDTPYAREVSDFVSGKTAKCGKQSTTKTCWRGSI